MFHLCKDENGNDYGWAKVLDYIGVGWRPEEIEEGIPGPVPEGYKGKVGRTCRDLAQLKELKKQSAYVFLGNIFDSQSEPLEPSTFTMNQLEEASDKGLIDKKVYALGGMNFDNIQIARDLGFGGVVIRGDLWNKFNIHNQMDYKELITYFEKLRKLIY